MMDTKPNLPSLAKLPKTYEVLCRLHLPRTLHDGAPLFLAGLSQAVSIGNSISPKKTSSFTSTTPSPQGSPPATSLQVRERMRFVDHDGEGPFP